MTTVEALQTLLAAIQTQVEAAPGDCPVEKFQVTAGQPAAPTGQCSVVSVWASSAFNSATSMFHDDSPCLIVRGVQLNWRLDLCHDVGEQDATAEENLAVATCFYGLADAIWCGLNDLIGAGTLFTGAKCADIQVDALTYNESSGGNVSAESGVRVQMDCDLEPES